MKKTDKSRSEIFGGSQMAMVQLFLCPITNDIGKSNYYERCKCGGFDLSPM